MKIEDYSEQAITTLLGQHAIGEDMSPALLSQIFGLVGESGKVAEKFVDTAWLEPQRGGSEKPRQGVLSRKERGVTSGGGDIARRFTGLSPIRQSFLRPCRAPACLPCGLTEYAAKEYRPCQQCEHC